MRLLLVLAGVLAVVAPAPAASVRTRVWIVSDAPLTVRGTGFASRDRVTVSVAKAKVSYRRTVVATRTGTFTARWTSGLPTTCATTKVVATGSSGRHATYLVVANDCMPIDPPVK